MAVGSSIIRAILERFKGLREKRGISNSQLEEALMLGPGWVSRFETAETIPNLDILLSMLHHTGYTLNDLIKDIQLTEPPKIVRQIRAEQNEDNLVIYFPYGEYDAKYVLQNATLAEFDSVIKELRAGLARLASANKAEVEAIKTDAIVKTFLKAAYTWPSANPSDLWWFLVYRAYCDPYNHPASYARLDLNQSWKRTSGWALEEVLVRHYGSFLKKQGINLFLAYGERKSLLLNQLKSRDRLEPAKVDVMLSGYRQDKEVCFGVIHVKASFAERRTDDVPMSRALIEAGYTSPLWTMDCKSTPSKVPHNKGELGIALEEGKDKRSAKRKDIEEDGYFSACFSYNRNTIPTPDDQPSKARIIVCDFTNPDDSFSRLIISEWNRFQKAPI